MGCEWAVSDCGTAPVRTNERTNERTNGDQPTSTHSPTHSLTHSLSVCHRSTHPPTHPPTLTLPSIHTYLLSGIRVSTLFNSGLFGTFTVILNVDTYACIFTPRSPLTHSLTHCGYSIAVVVSETTSYHGRRRLNHDERS